MISFRGILALVIGAGFVWFVFHPDALGGDPLPWVLRGLLFLVGTVLIVAGVVVSRFVYRRSRLLRSVEPTPAQVVIRVDEGSDSTTYGLEVSLPDGAWSLGAVGKTVAMHAADVPHAAEVWRDPQSGAPIAVAINGKQINTLPVPKRM